MAPIVSETASEELTLLISQNNKRRTVKIKQVSEELAKALGYMRSEMEGKLLAEFLGAKTADTLEDYLEYEDDGDDVDAVLGRVREFKLKSHGGEEQLFAQKIYREAPQDGNQWFRLILKDERRQIEERSLQVMLRENLAGVVSVNEKTGLADRTSCERYLEQVQAYVKTHSVNACFAVIRLDRYEKSLAQYGKDGCEELLQHVARHCKAKFREEDLVCRLSDKAIGLLLMDATEDTARVVLNRLRWFIASHRIAFAEKPNFSVTVSIVFEQMQEEAGAEILQQCERAMDAIGEDERSLLVEA